MVIILTKGEFYLICSSEHLWFGTRASLKSAVFLWNGLLLHCFCGLLVSPRVEAILNSNWSSFVTQTCQPCLVLNYVHLWFLPLALRWVLCMLPSWDPPSGKCNPAWNPCRQLARSHYGTCRQSYIGPSFPAHFIPLCAPHKCVGWVTAKQQLIDWGGFQTFGIRKIFSCFWKKFLT